MWYLHLLEKECTIAEKKRKKIATSVYYVRTNYPGPTFNPQRTKWKDEDVFLYGLTAETNICSRRTKCERATNGVPESNRTGVNVGINWRDKTVRLAAFCP